MPNRRRDLYEERSSAQYSEDLLAEQRRRKKVDFPGGNVRPDYQSRLNLQQEQAWARPAPQSLATPTVDRMLEDVKANWAQSRQESAARQLDFAFRKKMGRPSEPGSVGAAGRGIGGAFGSIGVPSVWSQSTKGELLGQGGHINPATGEWQAGPEGGIGGITPRRGGRLAAPRLAAPVVAPEAQPAGGMAVPAGVPAPAIDVSAWGGTMAPITLQAGEDFFQKATPYAGAEEGAALKGRKQEFDRQLSNMLRDRSFFNIEEYQRGGITLEAAGVDIQAHIRDRLFENMPANLRQEYQQKIGERKGIQEAENKALFETKGERVKEAEMRRQAQETLGTSHPMEVVRGTSGKLEYREIHGNEKFQRLTLAGQTKVEMDLSFLQTATDAQLVAKLDVSPKQRNEQIDKIEQYYGLGAYEQPTAPTAGIPAPAPVTPGRGFITSPTTGQTVQTGTPVSVPSITGQQGKVTPVSAKLSVRLDDPTLTPEERQSIQAKLNQLQGK